MDHFQQSCIELVNKVDEVLVNSSNWIRVSRSNNKTIYVRDLIDLVYLIAQKYSVDFDEALKLFREYRETP